MESTRISILMSQTCSRAALRAVCRGGAHCLSPQGPGPVLAPRVPAAGSGGSCGRGFLRADSAILCALQTPQPAPAPASGEAVGDPQSLLRGVFHMRLPGLVTAPGDVCESMASGTNYLGLCSLPGIPTPSRGMGAGCSFRGWCLLDSSPEQGPGPRVSLVSSWAECGSDAFSPEGLPLL